MSPQLVTFPVDFYKIRKALIDQVQLSTKLLCILAEPEQQNADRPPLPYFTLHFLNPTVKVGDDASTQQPGTTIWNVGGQRKMVADFNAYGRTHEEAYSYGALWQSSLELESVQSTLRAAGIAVWLNAGPLRDLSKLLNTGFEGRCQLEVSFGVASNLYEDRSAIEKVTIDGTVTSESGTENEITITGP